MAFDKMGIDTKEVIDAMNTKWNALGFNPGLVGGHCIGVDPYYFIYEAEKLGYHSRIISASRQINDDMPQFVGDAIIKQLILAGKQVKNAKVVFFGATFKENCPDVRNSKVMEIVKYLKDFEIYPVLVDPYADKKDVLRSYNHELSDISDSNDADCIVLAVAHDEFKKKSLSEWDKHFKDMSNDEKVIVDIKSILDKEEVLAKGFRYWRL